MGDDHINGACVSPEWFSAQDGCAADDDGTSCADMTSVCRQRWALLAGASASTLSTCYVMASYATQRRLRRRPGSLLFWRSACNLAFSLTIISQDLSYWANDGDSNYSFPDQACLDSRKPASGFEPGPRGTLRDPRSCVGGVVPHVDHIYRPYHSGCVLTAWWIQFFALGAESWYFLISVDLLANLVTSPFGSPDRRQRWYHLFVVVTGFITCLLLVKDGEVANFGPAGSDAAPGTYLIMHICWQREFGVMGENSGWTFFYPFTVFYYSFALCVMLYSWHVLRRGIAETYQVRQRQMKVGQKLVGILTLYLMGLLGVYNMNIHTADAARGWMGVLMAAWLGGRGIGDVLVWVFVMVPFAEERDGRAVHRCCCKAPGLKRSGLQQPLRLPSSVGRIKPTGGSAGGANGQRLSSGVAASSSSPGVATEEGAEAEEERERGEELNVALRDEVLYFTLLGLRTAVVDSSRRHARGEEDGGGATGGDQRTLDMQAVIDASAEGGAVDVDADADADDDDGSMRGRSQSDVERLKGLRFSLKRMGFAYTGYADGACRQLRDDIFTESGYLASLETHRDAHFDGGKSGAIFFFSADQRYIIKEVVTSERRTLMALLPSYVEHMRHHPESLLPRIMQVCSIRMYRRTLNFMVMKNVFSGPGGLVKPSAVYDIKGSWVDRNAGGTRSHRPQSGTYKDMDLLDKLYLPSSFRDRLQATLATDTLFLVGHRIMDYSLLLGVVNRPFLNGAKGGVQRRVPDSPCLLNAGDAAARPLNPQRQTEGSASPIFHQVDEGGVAAAVIQGPVYHMGMVDFLQVWDFGKKLERFYKVYILRKDPQGISVMNPVDYQRRFMENLGLITANDAELAMLERDCLPLSQSSA